jgi:hypothetical protein
MDPALLGMMLFIASEIMIGLETLDDPSDIRKLMFNKQKVRVFQIFND